MSLQRELRASWGPGYPSRVQFGGGDAAEDNTWEQLGAEEDAVVRVEWNHYVFNNATVKEAVNKYCDPATRDQVVEQYGPISDWDVSQVTSMNRLFHGKWGFNEDISRWDTSSVTDTSYMFDGASSFNQPLNSWDMSSVTDTSGMFNGASSFNQPLNSWDMTSVTDTRGMFNCASSFNQPLNSWDLSSVTDTSYMFNGASSFSQLNRPARV